MSDERQLELAEMDPDLAICLSCGGHPPFPCAPEIRSRFSCVNQVPMMAQAPERQQAFREQYGILATAAQRRGIKPRPVMLTSQL